MKTTVIWTEQDDRRLVRWSKEFVPVADIAARLGKAYGQVVARRGKMKASGRLKRLGNATHREWTELDDLELRTFFQEGLSYRHMARRLRRTETAVRVRMKRIGIRIQEERRHLTAREAAAVMGVPCSKTIAHWIKQGWLRGHKVTKGHSPYRIDPLELWSFVELHDAHMAWDPERITDPELKAHALDVRATAVRWLTPGEVAKRYGVCPHIPNVWINRGLLMGMRWGNWWIPEDALDGFIPPYEWKFLRKEQTDDLPF